jgi:hypothetical protein
MATMMTDAKAVDICADRAYQEITANSAQRFAFISPA